MTNMNCFSNLYKQYYHLQDYCESLPADNGDMLGFGQIKSYEQLGEAKPATLSLLDITPYVSACSEALGKSYSLFVPLLLEHEAPEVDKLYRMLMRNFCEAIAKDDGVITLSESEWLNEIAPQTDGAQNNGQGN